MGGTVVIPASRGGSLREYLASLERIRALQPRRLLPAHGPVVTDPQGLIDEYLAHRAARERQIVEALKDDCTRVEDLVARIYPDLSPSLRGAAEETVRAHLVKLRDSSA
jgi:glyoxylase-like metal-dependent hydrolase (beta-lactamase superfamily II)